ncbi:MAG: cytochrome P450 [Gammaproteobacteria bacterium]|nr:cytochrome P450 [Gammaproteobacteria bacterium]MCY4183220.1 cytochrome P450 [Gammaproteobacteria bacterium]MCY4297188.1 cytochrome P450 [Gammaproteobacteria bacterium]
MALADNLIDPDLIPSCGGMPHDLFDAWRETDPVHWNPPVDDYQPVMTENVTLSRGFWVLTRHQDVVDVSRDQELFSSHEGGPLIWDFEGELLAEQRAGFMGMRPADHKAVRKLIMPPFAAGELAKFYPEIDRIASSIIDSVADRGQCEFVFDVASKLPVYTFCKLLGVPDDLRESVFTFGNQTADTENPDRAEDPRAAIQGLYGIAHQLAAEKRANPDNSMLSRVVHGEVDGERLDDATILMFFVTLSIAGHETTRGTATQFVRLMREHPEQYELLRGDPDKYLPNAIEEVLRHSPPVIKFRRTVMADTEIGGQQVKKGDKIYLSYPAANRDPAVFADPHRFDITRENANKHLSFGTGPHICLGARLARYQLKALLKEIVTRIPDIHPEGDWEMMRSIWFNAIIKMPVRFTPEAAAA